MTSTTRTDQHRPQVFDPADYRVVDYIDNRRPEPPHPASGAYGNPEFMALYERAVADWQARIFEHFPDWRTGGGDHTSIHQCNHCGHPGIRWVAVVEHVPTGAKLAFGEQCADRVELPGRDAFRSKFIKDRAQREAVMLANQLADAQFDVDNPGLRDYLFEHEHDEFLGSLYRQLNRKHELSEKQIEAARRSQNREEAWEERKREEREAMAEVEPLAEGRYLIEGEVLSTKWQDNGYGGALKMLVKLDDGNKVWGTVPEALASLTANRVEHNNPDDFHDVTFVDGIELKGQRVRLTAQVERSRDDPHFGFYKRPTGATLVGQEVA